MKRIAILLLVAIMITSCSSSKTSKVKELGEEMVTWCDRFESDKITRKELAKKMEDASERLKKMEDEWAELLEVHATSIKLKCRWEDGSIYDEIDDLRKCVDGLD